MEEDFYSRIVADGAVGVAGAATLIAASGLTDSVAYNGVGDVTINFRAPGPFKNGIQDPDSGALNVVIAFFQLQGARGFVDYSAPSLTSIRVKTYDTTNTPADIAFAFMMKTTQRRLV